MEGNKSKPENFDPVFSDDSEDFIRVTDDIGSDKDIQSSDETPLSIEDDVLSFELPKEDLESVFGKEVGSTLYSQSLKSKPKQSEKPASDDMITTVTGKHIPNGAESQPVIKHNKQNKSEKAKAPNKSKKAEAPAKPLPQRPLRDKNGRRIDPSSAPAEEPKKKKSFHSGQMLKVVDTGKSKPTGAGRPRPNNAGSPKSGQNEADHTPTGPANKDNYRQYINKADHRKPIISDSAKNEVKKGVGFLRKNIIGIAIVAAVAVVAIIIANMILSLGSIKAQAVSYSNGVKISWETVDNAREYQIYKKIDGQWLPLQTTKKLSYTDKKVENGEKYNYKVRAVNGSRHSKYNHMTTTYYDAVKVTDFTFKDMSVTITWKASSSATSYKVYRAVNDGEKELLETISDGTTTYSDSGLEMDNDYYYSIIQMVGRTEGAYPKNPYEVSLNFKFDSVSAANSPKGVRVSWKGEVSSATAINIYRKVSGGEWTLAGTTKPDATEFYDNDNPDFGKKTWYKVAASINGAEANSIKTKNSFYTIDPSKKLVALTYDDGPYTPVTNALLDTFEKYNVRATFFIVGDRIVDYTDCVKRAAKLDMELASHTYDHMYLTQLSDEEIEYQLSENDKVIKEVNGGKEVTLLRPPGGYNITGIDYPEILWSVDTLDWSNRNADTTLSNAKSGIYDGSIVLMHDLYSTSAEATASLVPWLIENGYQIVTVSELFEARGITLENGVSYVDAPKQ